MLVRRHKLNEMTQSRLVGGQSYKKWQTERKLQRVYFMHGAAD